MIFFIPWVVFLLAIILAVPIASMMEKRGMQAAYEGGYEDGGYDDAGGLSDGDEELEPLDDAGGLEEGSIEPQQDGDDPFGTGAPDDFSAFDEEFK